MYILCMFSKNTLILTFNSETETLFFSGHGYRLPRNTYNSSFLPSFPHSFRPLFNISVLPSFFLSFLPSFCPSFLPFRPSFLTLCPSSPISVLTSLFPSYLPSFRPSVLPSFFLSFLPSFCPSFLLSVLPSVLPSFLSPSSFRPSVLQTVKLCRR